jgi:hypothetical protein
MPKVIGTVATREGERHMHRIFTIDEASIDIHLQGVDWPIVVSIGDDDDLVMVDIPSESGYAVELIGGIRKRLLIEPQQTTGSGMVAIGTGIAQASGGGSARVSIGGRPTPVERRPIGLIVPRRARLRVSDYTTHERQVDPGLDVQHF